MNWLAILAIWLMVALVAAVVIGKAIKWGRGE